MAGHSFKGLQVKRSDCLWFDPEDLVLVTDKESPFYDERVELPVDEKLVANILFNLQGVLEPVLICKDGTDPIVLAGRQRVKAARQANIQLLKQGSEPLKVPCMVKKGDEENLFGLLVSENEHRKDDSILAKAKKIQKYYSLGGDRKGAAKIFGVSVQAISNWEKILDLASAVIKAIEAGLITASAAAKLADLTRKEQVEKLEELLKESGDKRPSGKKVTSKTGQFTFEKKPKARTLKQIEKVMEDENLNIPGEAYEALQWVIKIVHDIPSDWKDTSNEDLDLDLD